MPRDRRIRIGLSADDEIIADLHFDDRHRLAHFSVTYVATFGTKKREVGRYDNAHGAAHIHRYGPDERVVACGRRRSAKNIVDHAIADFRANWKKYRARLEHGLK